MGNNKIRVKLCTFHPKVRLRQFPKEKPVWGNCEFIFNPEEREYDWFVIYDDFPRSEMDEKLACSPHHTLLVTTEPPSIKSYGNDFTKQFGCVLTSQPQWSLSHSDRIYSQTGLHWYYGLTKEAMCNYDQIVASNFDKKEIISTVCSSKKQRHTLHNRRYHFIQGLKRKIPYLEVFGHGVRDMKDKAESLNDFKYHIAIENYQGEHHWTEKLADPFLGQCLPFYFGCPNASDYFPEESFIPIDIFDLDGSYEVIQRAIFDDEYKKRYPYIIEARDRVLSKYNLFAVLNREITARHSFDARPSRGITIFSRRLLRKKRPTVAIRDFIEKSRVRLIIMIKKNRLSF